MSLYVTAPQNENPVTAGGNDFHMDKADGNAGETETQRRWYGELESVGVENVGSQQAECVMASGTVKWFHPTKVMGSFTI